MDILEKALRRKLAKAKKEGDFLIMRSNDYLPHTSIYTLRGEFVGCYHWSDGKYNVCVEVIGLIGESPNAKDAKKMLIEYYENNVRHRK